MLGNNGAGKTTFLRLVRGDIWPAPGCGHRFYRVNGGMKEGPIGFRENTGLVSSELLDLYRTMEWNLSGLEVVCTGFEGTPLLCEKPDEIRSQGAKEILAMLGIEDLADRRILGMSQGEAKKTLIARSLVKKPTFLFLDELASGLDSSSEEKVMDLVHGVVEQGTHVLLAAHDARQLPRFVTHVVHLRSGLIAEQGPVSDACAQSGSACGRNRRPGSRTIPKPRIEEKTDKPLIRIENADVDRGRTRILRQITWTVETGQNWALLGRNGSGKTTLLKLIVGDRRPVWGGKISRFGLEGPQSVWEMRRRISLVTLDLQAMHASRQTGINMVLSGFYGSVGLPHEPTEAEKEIARSWFQQLGLEELQNREVRTLSYGQVRALLVMRAVVTNPIILLLDEPLSGLDDHARSQVMSVVEEFAGPKRSVIYVTHNEAELSPLLDHVAVLEKGRMIFQGTRKQWDRSR